MNIRAFEFESGPKKVLIGGMVIGLISLVATFLTDDQYHTAFWSNWLHNSVFFTGIAFTSAFFLAGNITGFAGWMTAIRRIWEAMSMFMLVGIGLLAVLALGVWGHLHHLYHWNAPGIADPASPHFDEIIAGKKPFLNPVWYTIAAVGFVAVWYFIAKKLRDVSLAQDAGETPDLKLYRKSRNWAALYLPIAGFLSPLFFWLLTMSIDPHWYSTMYAWYSMVSMWLASIALTIILIVYLKSKGHLEYVSRDHVHDVGKFLFGISIFWTYLWFDQFMLIWYANNGEETIYFKERMEHYPILFWGNLLLNFIAPFFILMRNDNKRKYGTLLVAACVVFFGHWWDYFYMIKPGVRISAFEASHMEGHGDAHHGAANLTDHVKEAAHDIKHEVKEGAEKVAATAEHVADKAAAAADHAVDKAHEVAPHTTEAATKAVEAAHGAVTHVAEKVAGEAEHATETVAHAVADAHSEATDDGHAGAGHGDAHGAVVARHGGGPGDKSFKVGYTIPGFLDIGTMIGFLSLFLFLFFGQLARASLLPKNDPFLDETLHHTTGAHIDSEIEAAGGAGHH